MRSSQKALSTTSLVTSITATVKNAVSDVTDNADNTMKDVVAVIFYGSQEVVYIQ